MNNLKALKREKLTSGSNNKLRANGFIPAILYGGKDPNQNISVSKKELSSIINSGYVESQYNSIYHYHGTCEIGTVVDSNHQVIGLNKLYVGDASILSQPWGGSTSVPSAVAGYITASNIINTEELNLSLFQLD